LTRAIKAGRLSTTRRDDNGYEIDPAELILLDVNPSTAAVVATRKPNARSQQRW
jgi:hypothetical protein